MRISEYVNAIEPRPKLKLPTREILLLNGLTVEGETEEGVEKLHNAIEVFLRQIPFEYPLKFVMIGKRGEIKIKKRGGEKRRKFLEKLERYYNAFVNAREIKLYAMLPEGREENRITKISLNSLGLKFTDGYKDFLKDLSEAMMGQEDFSFVIEEWERGVRVVNRVTGKERWGVVLPLISSPEITYPFHISLIKTLTDDFVFSVSFKKVPVHRFRTQLEAKRKYLEGQKGEHIEEIRRELAELAKELALGRENLFYSVAFLAVFKDTKEEAIEKAKEIEFELKKSGLEFISEGTAESQVFINLFEEDFRHLEQYGYVRKMITSAFACMLPLATPPKGAKEGMPLLTESFTVFYLDFYEKMPPNATIIGQMGSGKSFLCQNIALHMDYVIFVEKIQGDEGSYAVFTKAFDGEYYPIALERPVSINPFGNTIYTVDSIAFIEKALGEDYREYSNKDLILLQDIMNERFFEKEKLTKEEIIKTLEEYEGTEFLIYKIKSKNFEEWKVKIKIDREKLGRIKSILKLMYELGERGKVDSAIVEKIALITYERVVGKGKRKAERELLMSDFVETAKMLYEETKEEIYSSLAERWFTYTKGGTYGEFFDRPCDLKLSEFVYFEVRPDDKELLPLIVMSIATNAVEWFSKPNMADKKKGLIIDEAWYFIQNPVSREFIKEALRTYRKKGIFMALASQKPEEFAIEGISELCPYQFFLYTQQNAHERIAQTFSLNETEKEILSLIKPPAEYRFAFAKTYLKTPYENGGIREKGMFYVISSREFYWIATTHPPDKVKREEYKNRYGSLAKAIEQLAAEDMAKAFRG